MPFRGPPKLDDDNIAFAKLAARHCKLPHPTAVEAWKKRNVFPSIRDARRRTEYSDCGTMVLDDNIIPRWALFWSHGFEQTDHPTGWTIAHIWALPRSVEAYTNLANLTVMPECLGSLSDKKGPLVPFLQYHSFDRFDWHPTGEERPKKPAGYESIEWKYFTPIDKPRDFVEQRLRDLNNQRVIKLRNLMGLND